MHAFLCNLRGNFYDLARPLGVATSPLVPALTQHWGALTADLLAQ